MRRGLTLYNLKKSFIEFDILKAPVGVYTNTSENRRLGRVGQKYGHKHEGLLPDFNTKNRHSKDGIYSQYRKKVHDDIRKRLFERAVVNENPTVILLMGGSSSGKGSSSMRLRDENADVEKVILDSDNIKMQLPEYEKFSKETAANNVHKESSSVGNSIRGNLIDMGADFVNDSTFSDRDKAVDMIKKLRKKGYKIKLINVTTSIEVAKEREQERFERTGRRVPEKTLEDTHIGGAKNYEELKGLVDEYALLDNNAKGAVPILIDSHDGGVVDKGRYQSFLDKRHYKKA
jgi:predicted ABC-type ATPase